jgi:heme/copper-type cytochrome/quinol oxidase subunit 4
MNKEVRFVRAVLNALTWLIIGMTLMARFYTAKFHLTGGDAIGWDMVAVVLIGLALIQAVLHLDPSFKED